MRTESHANAEELRGVVTIQLAECRASVHDAIHVGHGFAKDLDAMRTERDTLTHELSDCPIKLSATGDERDKLRALCQGTLNWMRQTDSARPVREVIHDLEAGLEATK